MGTLYCGIQPLKLLELQAQEGMDSRSQLMDDMYEMDEVDEINRITFTYGYVTVKKIIRYPMIVGDIPYVNHILFLG